MCQLIEWRTTSYANPIATFQYTESVILGRVVPGVRVKDVVVPILMARLFEQYENQSSEKANHHFHFLEFLNYLSVSTSCRP